MPVSIHHKVGLLRLDIESTTDMSEYDHPKLKSLNFQIGFGKEGHQRNYDVDVSAKLLRLGCIGIALIPFACAGAGWFASQIYNR